MWAESEGKCFLCEKPGHDCHHIHYEFLGQERIIEVDGKKHCLDAVLLCRQCHGETHNKIPSYERYLNDGFSLNHIVGCPKCGDLNYGLPKNVEP